jgi:hypothetical protein
VAERRADHSLLVYRAKLVEKRAVQKSSTCSHFTATLAPTIPADTDWCTKVAKILGRSV